MSEPTNSIILWDIDGVLADPTARLPHILVNKPADWDTFDKLTPTDTPIRSMIRLLNLTSLNPFIKIILITGRADRGNVRRDTEQWLHKNGVAGWNKLHMRKNKDHRPAVYVKQDICEEHGYTPDSVMTFFEDQPDTIEGFRDAGFHVCDVGGWKDGYTEILSDGGPQDD